MVGKQAHLVTESLTALCELDFIWAKRAFQQASGQRTARVQAWSALFEVGTPSHSGTQRRQRRGQ